MKYIVNELETRGYTLNGSIQWEGEERDDKGDRHHAVDSVADPQDDEGGNGNDGHGLQENGIGIEATLDYSGLGK